MPIQRGGIESAGGRGITPGEEQVNDGAARTGERSPGCFLPLSSGLTRLGTCLSSGVPCFGPPAWLDTAFPGNREIPMPIYEYDCTFCGASFERLQRFSDPDPEACSACGAPSPKRRISASAFHLKGTGWYTTDYARKGAPPEDKGGEKPSLAATSGSGEKSGAGEGAKAGSEGVKTPSETASPSPSPSSSPGGATPSSST